jgi:hypothetical protein
MPFHKGQSGNPEGRPRKGTSIREALREYAGKRKPGEAVPRGVRIAMKILDLAEEGNLLAAQMALDQVDGKVVQPVDTTHRQAPPEEHVKDVLQRMPREIRRFPRAVGENE